MIAIPVPVMSELRMTTAMTRDDARGRTRQEPRGSESTVRVEQPIGDTTARSRSPRRRLQPLSLASPYSGIVYIRQRPFGEPGPWSGTFDGEEQYTQAQITTRDELQNTKGILRELEWGSESTRKASGRTTRPRGTRTREPSRKPIE